LCELKFIKSMLFEGHTRSKATSNFSELFA
jgi:hypothetical protein